MKMRRLIGTAIAALLVFSVTSATAEMKKVNVALSSASISAAAPRIAKEMGLFKKYDLDPNIISMETSSVATTALISGSVDFNVSGASELVIAQARGQKVVAISSVYRGFAAVLVLSKAAADKRGLSPTATIDDRLKALDGLLIASPAATSTFTFGVKAAEALGAKVRMTYMGQPAMIAALETGAIDGFLASAPYYATPILHGTGVLWISGPKGEFPSDYAPANVTLNAMQSSVDANPDLMHRMASALADFGSAVRERPVDVKAAIARLYPDIDAKTLDFLFEIESKPFAFNPVSVDDMAHEIHFVKLSGAQLPGLDTIDPAKLVWK
jgi:ABC-type nitrate/sulfonate/bicarbonate transport system substrate-binding protein